MDYYKVLGVAKDATIEEIKRAYRELSKASHPDFNKAQKADHLFIIIKEAYDILGDPVKRHAYDEEMGFTHDRKKYQDKTNYTYKRPSGNNYYESRRYDENAADQNSSDNYDKTKDATDKEFKSKLLVSIIIGMVVVVIVFAFMQAWSTSVPDNRSLGDTSANSGGATTSGSNQITVEVSNRTEEIIISLALFYGDNLDDRGEELLGDEVIAPGEAYTFLLPQGIYSVLFFTYENYIITSARDFNDSIRIQVGGGGKIPILFKNLTEGDIAFLSILESGKIDFEGVILDEDVIEIILEADALGLEVLPAGIGQFIFIRPGTYDLIGLNYDLEVVFSQSAINLEQDSVITIGQ